MTDRSDDAAFYRDWLERSALDPDRIQRRAAPRGTPPENHKTYPESARLALQPPPLNSPRDLWKTLQHRRSRRTMSATTPITRRELGALLWACQGVTARAGPQLLRTAPSAGALYPLETYVSIQRVEDLQPCLAHLHVPSFELELLSEGRFGPHLAQASLGQRFVASAALVVVWTAVLPRCAWKYGPRAVRYLGLDLGHVCQNLALAAEALGLHCCPVAAFLDRELNLLLEVDGREEFAYYLAAVGQPPG